VARAGGGGRAPRSRRHGDKRDGGHDRHVERRAWEAAMEFCGLIVTGTKGMVDATEAAKMPTRHAEWRTGGTGGAPRSQRQDERDADREEDAGAE
jgi:hypothetical protein